MTSVYSYPLPYTIQWDSFLPLDIPGIQRQSHQGTVVTRPGYHTVVNRAGYQTVTTVSAGAAVNIMTVLVSSSLSVMTV